MGAGDEKGRHLRLGYRQLNLVTKKDSYPLPRIDDILASLGAAKHFFTLDYVIGYWQVSLTGEVHFLFPGRL